MNEAHYGWVVNTHYDYLNLLTRLEKHKPNRFDEFKYSKATIYYYLDRLQHEQNLHD